MRCVYGKLLLVQQRKGSYRGQFDLPGGKMEPGETVEETLRREFGEEVGMTFDRMQLVDNLTSITEAREEDGRAYILHRIGLIYLIHGLSPLPHASKELDTFWIDPLQQLQEMPMSSFAEQMLQRVRKELDHENRDALIELGERQ